MSLSRSELKEWGVPDEAIDKVMAGYGKEINARVPKDEAETQAKLAVEKALNEFKASLPRPTKVEDSEEYKKLLAKINDYELNDKLRGYKIKPKFLGDVKAKLDRTKLDESLEGLKKEYAEYFEEEQGQNNGQNANSNQNGENQKSPMPTFANNQTNQPNNGKSEKDIIKEQFLAGFKGVI